MVLNREQIQRLIQQVIDTQAEELSCDEMMRVLTIYAEKLANGIPIEVVDDEHVQHHLDICPECREEFEMIKSIANEGHLGTE
jgi:hypothetical protein